MRSWPAQVWRACRIALSRWVPSGIFLVRPSVPDWFLSDRGHRPEIVFGVLIIVLRLDGVAG